MEVPRSDIEIIPINNNSDVGVCRRKGVSLAKRIGFDDVKAGEIAIMVSEMATNVIKHGGGKGNFLMCRISDLSPKDGIEFWCCDYGNGILDLNTAIVDGYTEKNSLGLGLGAIRRLSDEMDVNPAGKETLFDHFNHNVNDSNSCLRTRKWLPERNWNGLNKNLVMGAVSKATPVEKLNGDAFVFENYTTTKCIAAVIDGLGHGKEANKAADIVKATILKKPELPPDIIIKNCHDAARGTRGVTLGVVKADTSANKLFFSGIGNIEGYLLSDRDKKNLLSYGGIVGHNIRTPRVFEFDFYPGNTVYLYSDGITTRWGYEEFDWNMHPQTNAENIFNKHARLNDDATILIFRYNT